MVFRDLIRIYFSAFMRQFLLITLALTCSGCSLWPYKSDFDCPVGDGVKCTSLYEISQMADRGEFGPQSKRHAEFKAKKERGKKRFRRKCSCKKINNS